MIDQCYEMPHGAAQTVQSPDQKYVAQVSAGAREFSGKRKSVIGKSRHTAAWRINVKTDPWGRCKSSVVEWVHIRAKPCDQLRSCLRNSHSLRADSALRTQPNSRLARRGQKLRLKSSGTEPRPLAFCYSRRVGWSACAC